MPVQKRLRFRFTEAMTRRNELLLWFEELGYPLRMCM